jgi:hypothetical protein
LRGDAPPAPTLEQLAEPDAIVISLIGVPAALARLMSVNAQIGSPLLSSKAISDGE